MIGAGGGALAYLSLSMWKSSKANATKWRNGGIAFGVGSIEDLSNASVNNGGRLIRTLSIEA